MLLPLLFLFLHWLSVRTYAGFCVPEGIHGLFWTVFTTGSPICTFNMQVMEFTRLFYTQAWVLLGVMTLWMLKGVMGVFGTAITQSPWRQNASPSSSRKRLVRTLTDH